jgi:hypothetical protein
MRLELGVARHMREAPGFATFGASAGFDRWRAVDAKSFPAEVVTTPQTTIADLTAACLAAARSRGIVDPEPDPAASDRGRAQRILETWLAPVAVPGRLDRAITVEQAGLHDGDAVELCIDMGDDVAAELAWVPNPQMLFAGLQLELAVREDADRPRLWGALLYTEADVELATYVRAYFDDLNAMSGSLLRIFVVERLSRWSMAQHYWRQHLEPPLMRVFTALRWLVWQPYDKQACYEIARGVGLDVDALPCLVLFESAPDGDKLVFPIASATPAYLRRLFAEIYRAVEGREPAFDLARADQPFDRALLGPFERGEHDADGGSGSDQDSDADAVEAGQQLRRLVSGDRDLAAFSRVRAAFDRIRAALDSTIHTSRVTGARFHDHPVFVIRGGDSMTDSFHFHGQTTFINRPVDTVIQDFQNRYQTGPAPDELNELLRLILSSVSLSNADKQDSAAAVYDLADDFASGGDRSRIREKLSALGSTLAGVADVAKPALEIVAKISGMING